MTFIFISHSSKDQKVARTLCDALERRGSKCWMASRDIKPGENFQETIVRTIRMAQVMVLLFTENANNSNEVKKELALASQNKLIVIPVRVEDVVPSDAFLYELATRQWIDLFEDWETAIERLIRQVNTVLSGSPASAAEAKKVSDDLAEIISKPTANENFLRSFAKLTGVAALVLIFVGAGTYAVWRTVGHRVAKASPVVKFGPCLECVAMVTIPSGSFAMGSSATRAPGDEAPPRYAVSQHAEQPQHIVQVASFEIAKYPVTRGEFGTFTAQTGYSATACKVGFSQTDHDPIVCLSSNDIHAYINWLSAKSGKPYRLPSEAEWEYATRSGATSSWFWGSDQIGQCRFANGADLTSKDVLYRTQTFIASCRDNFVHTAPVGSFQPNGWGLYDMVGNVAQWTDDCWNETYSGAPSDGRARTDGDCTKRVVRGGSWNSPPWYLRSAMRSWEFYSQGSNTIGFRLAMTP